MKKSSSWVTFLRIPEPNTNDIVPALDPGWCVASGVYPGAEVVLRLLRDEVLPLIKNCEKLLLTGYHFLIHDRLSGVPTTENDKSNYIHLRLNFKQPTELKLSNYPRFEMTRPAATGQTSVGGIDLIIVKNQDLEKVNRLIELQSEWMLALIDAHEWKDDALMVRQVKQFLHFTANMAQMRVVG